MGSQNLGYEETLAASIGINLPHTSTTTSTPPPSTKSPSDPRSTPTILESGSPEQNLINLKTEWGRLVALCAEPKTTMKIVETMRAQVLTTLRDTKAVNMEVVNMLDSQWDLLGTDRVSLYIHKFISHPLDLDVVSGVGPSAFLKGMICAVQESNKSQVNDLLEKMAGTTADLTLASDSVQMFKRSIKKAESSWRNQSSDISASLSSIEARLKELITTVDSTIPLRSHGSPNTAPACTRGKSPPPCNHTSDPQLPVQRKYQYVQDSSSHFSLQCEGPPSARDRKIINQIKVFISKIGEDERLLHADPELLCDKFWRELEADKGQNPGQLLERLLGEQQH